MSINCHVVALGMVMMVCITSFFTNTDYKEVLLAIGAGYFGLQSNGE